MSSTIAFFGATGGSTISCLAPALQAGYHCTALVRSPSKLLSILSTRNIPESTISAHLSIIAGNISDLSAVQKTLQPAGPGTPLADLIISGIGGKLLFNSPIKPTLDNPTVCQDAVRTILQAAREAVLPSDRDSDSDSDSATSKPTLVVLSTTGISAVARDLPYAMYPLYHWMLRVPHDDKRVMEELIRAEMSNAVEKRGIGQYVIVRPSLLTEGDGDGVHKIRAGVEEKPAVGYAIAREDVGKWVFEEVVGKGASCAFLGEVVSITT